MPTLKQAQDKVRELSKKGLDCVEDPTTTFAEKKTALDVIEADIKKWTDEVEQLQFVDDRRKNFLKDTGGHLGDAGSDQRLANDDNRLKSIGEQFVTSAQYKSAIGDGNLKGGNWATGDIQVKTTLTEGDLTTPGGGYQTVSALPTLLPGIVDIKFRQLTVADLFPQGQTSTPLIRYLVETAITNAATAVAEGALKPESAISFTKVDEVLHKLATFLPISDEMLEDWAQAMSYIDARLILFIALAEEAQLLSGDGTGANLLGILNRPGLATPIVKGTVPSLAGDNDMDAIYRQITVLRYTSFIEPDSIVLDPTSWQNVLLSKNTYGQYYANGPFVGEAPLSLWGKKVVVTPAMAAGTALVGGFALGGQVFRKGGLVVDASNSHADYFQRNLTAIRAELRLALAIYRPGAFGLITGL